MKIRIFDREYAQVTRATAQALHLMELRAHSVPLVDEGLIAEPLGMTGLGKMERAVRAYVAANNAYRAAVEAHRAAVEAGDAGAPHPGDPPDPPDEGLILTGVTVFLTRRGAGDVVGLRECFAVSESDLEEIREATDPPERAGEQEPDPTSPGSGGPETAGDGGQGPTDPMNGLSTISPSQSENG